jgi:hypothetical protein
MKKIYHTRIPNSTFIVQRNGTDGKPAQGQTELIQFRGETYETEDADYIAQLDAVADKPGCPIYTKDKKTALIGENVPFQQVKERAAEVVEQIAKSGQRA